jgi:exodeoxyribonuclease VII small subunit
MALPGAKAHPYTPRRVARTKASPPPRAADPAAGAEPDGDARGVDEILEGLEAVVQQLESGELPLEEALARFEHGVRLARRGGQLLDAVEQRVEKLLAERDETVPFSAEDER